jgi:hypothetical protein
MNHFSWEFFSHTWKAVAIRYDAVYEETIILYLCPCSKLKIKRISGDWKLTEISG